VAVLGTSYQIGNSALAAYQAAIAVTGQNIANVGNPDYARQTGRLEPINGGTTSSGTAPGAGINLANLQRHLDEAVESRLRLSLAERSGAEARYQSLSRVEALYDELTEYDLSSQLNKLFGGLASLQADPTETTARNLVIAQADAVIETLQRHRNGLLNEASDLNNTIEELTQNANVLASEIAELNELIVTAEAHSPGGAGALRDRRDGLLRELGELMEVETREQSNGILNVYVGSEPLVDFNHSRGLTTEAVLEDGVERVTVRFADNNGTVILREGQVGALQEARDVHLAGQIEKLDGLTRALIYEVNRVHSSGRGLVGYSSLMGSYAVDDATAALNSDEAGLVFPVENGTFLVHVGDPDTERTTTRLIAVDLDGLNDDDTTLTSLAAALDAVPNLNATVTADNRLQLSTDAGCEATFSEDSSGALAALGVAGFFEGTDARTMDVASAVRADPRLIATSLNGAPGDGSNAGRLAAVGSNVSDLLAGQTIQDFHAGLVNTLAVQVSAAQTEYEASDAVYSSLLAQREATSGVSLDEEAINLTKYERAFQGASRFLSVLDSLTSEVLSLV